MYLFHFYVLEKINFDLLVKKKLRILLIVVSKSRHILYGFVLFLVMISTTGCGRIIIHFTRPLFNDITRSFMQQQDVVLAEQGIPAFLLILDGLIEHSPKDKSLLLTGAKAYSSYTAAFVGDKYPERNKILAEKAKEYAFRAFNQCVFRYIHLLVTNFYYSGPFEYIKCHINRSNMTFQ